MTDSQRITLFRTCPPFPATRPPRFLKFREMGASASPFPSPFPRSSPPGDHSAGKPIAFRHETMVVFFLRRFLNFSTLLHFDG